MKIETSAGSWKRAKSILPTAVTTSSATNGTRHGLRTTMFVRKSSSLNHHETSH